MNKSEVKDIVKNELEKFIKDSLDKEIKDVLKKSTSLTRKETLEIIKDAIESVYKMFWYKRDFWKKDIK